MILAVSLTWCLHSDNSLSHEGIAHVALVLQLLECTMRATQTKTGKIACGALKFLHTTMKMACGTFIYNTYNIQCFTNQKNCTTCSTRWNMRTRMKLHGHVKFDIHNWLRYLCYNKDWSLSTVVSAEYVSTGQINVGPNWINDRSKIYQR